jgi:hypothetical protein
MEKTLLALLYAQLAFNNVQLAFKGRKLNLDIYTTLLKQYS